MEYTSFKALSFDALCERLCEKKNTLIVYHARPDADAIGSAFALRELLVAMGIPAFCACADEIPKRLEFLTEDVQGSALIDSLPTGHERVISVDSASPQQLGCLFERLHKDIDLMIDHHAVGAVYADNYVDPNAAACAEIIFSIAEWLFERGIITYIPNKVYICVYAALSSDTGCFKFANVTPETHICAAKLIRAGVNSSLINHLLYESKSLKQIKAEGEAAKRLTTYAHGKIASVLFPYSAKFSLGLSQEHLETIIDIPRSLSGVEVAFVVKQLEDEPVFKVSMRSNGEFDVSAVCAKFGGGGHAKAAGCTVEAPNIDLAEKLLLEAIKEVLSE